MHQAVRSTYSAGSMPSGATTSTDAEDPLENPRAQAMQAIESYMHALNSAVQHSDAFWQRRVLVHGPVRAVDDDALARDVLDSLLPALPLELLDTISAALV